MSRAMIKTHAYVGKSFENLTSNFMLEYYMCLCAYSREVKGQGGDGKSEKIL